jgi:hypothetical protein
MKREICFGRFWNTTTKGWAVFINGEPLRNVNGMNPKIPGPVRRFKTKESAEQVMLLAR